MSEHARIWLSLRQMFCGHNSTETVETTTPRPWGSVTLTHTTCLRCGKANTR